MKRLQKEEKLPLLRVNICVDNQRHIRDDIYFTSEKRYLDHWQKKKENQSTTQDKLQSFQETIRSKLKTTPKYTMAHYFT